MKNRIKMKSPTLIAALALATLLAIPPILQTHRTGPDLSDVKLEAKPLKAFPAPASVTAEGILLVAAPASCADCHITAAPSDVAAVAAPRACDHGTTLVNAAEPLAIHRHALHDPGRHQRWQSDTMKRTAGESIDIITAIFRHARGSGGGGLAFG